MRITEKPVAELVRASAETGADVFLRTSGPFDAQSLSAFARELDENPLILTPGRMYPPPGVSFPVLQANMPLPDAPAFADVRILTDERLTEELVIYGSRTLILPFAECAFVSEHGYRAAYKMIGELRAAGIGLRAAALLAGAGPQDERLRELFGSKDAILLGEPIAPELPAARFETPRERDACLLRLASLWSVDQTVILFPTRTNAEHFAAFAGQRLRCGVLHGGISPEENESTVAKYAAGALNVLLATKHVLPSAPFLKADRVVYAGLPFSPAHAARCAALSRGEPLSVLYCDDDLTQARTLSEGFARAVGADLARFMAVREEKLRAVVASLRE